MTYCRTHSFTSTCFTVNLTETARYETLRSLESRKKGKWLSSLTNLWAPTQSGSAPDTAITVNHETDPREKGRDLIDPMTTWQHKNATKNFDCTTISDILRTVSWRNDSYPTGVVKLEYGIPTFPPNRNKTKRNFSAALPASALVLISVANFKIYS